MSSMKSSNKSGKRRRSRNEANTSTTATLGSGGTGSTTSSRRGRRRGNSSGSGMNDKNSSGNGIPNMTRVKIEEEEAVSDYPMLKKIPLYRSDSFPILSIDFADFWGFWVFYLMLILMGWWVIQAVPYTIRMVPALTIVNVTHSIISLYLMHFRKGTMDSFDSGVYESATFWELFDTGRHYTRGKKLFTIIPILLCMGACAEQHYQKRYYFANVLAMVACLLPKHPAFDGLRLFGLNA